MRAMTLKLNGVEYELRADNAAIFTFYGDDQKYNHLFITTDEDNAVYLFADDSTLMQIAEQQVVQMHFLPLTPPDVDKQAHGLLKNGRGIVYVQNISDENCTMRAVSFADEPQTEVPLTKEEVDYYAGELEDDDALWDELDNG